jgi:cellobiose phosphorylase
MQRNKNLRLENPLGLSFGFNENGSVKGIEAGPVRISLAQTSPFSEGGACVYLRKRGSPCSFTPLFGPHSDSRFVVGRGAFHSSGSWQGIEYRCVLSLSTKDLSWQWRIELSNTGDSAADLDLVCVQDAGLKTTHGGAVNEYYVSQYIERLILEDEQYGAVICCRQNMKESGGHPWLMLACREGAVSGSTDGMQIYGKTYRHTGVAEGLKSESLGGEYAGESSRVALQGRPFHLEARGRHSCDFAFLYVPDHPLATSAGDLRRLPGLFREFGGQAAAVEEKNWIKPVFNLFNTSPFLPTEELNTEEMHMFFGLDRREAERESGYLASFFCRQTNHVMMHRKELLAERPHAHIMQAKTAFVPDENDVSTTSYAYGAFNSHLSQGNTNFNSLLSVCTSPFNLSRESGQRIFVEIQGMHYLLGIPAVFEMGLNRCRWIYKSGDYCFQVRTWTSKRSPRVNLDFKVLSGPDVSLLITHDFDRLNHWAVYPSDHPHEYVAKPGAESMMAGKFPKAGFKILINSDCDFTVGDEGLLLAGEASGDDPLFVIRVNKTPEFYMSFVGELKGPVPAENIKNADKQYILDAGDAQDAWRELSSGLSLHGTSRDVAAFREILPWFGMNALTHYLTPHGLEQFGGAAWGTRDVAQGPLELLLTMEKYQEARQVLCILFSNQNADGGWPQWWMFDSYRNVRADSSHGDIYYWCIIALSQYIRLSGDLEIMKEVLPYYHEGGMDVAEKAPLREHLERLNQMIIGSFIPGTALVPYGGGDWNDSLQPVSRELAGRMISSWTVEMNYQAFKLLSGVYEKLGEKSKAEDLQATCGRIREDFNRHLIREGVVAGYGLVQEDGTIRLLLHPGDTQTNIHYSLLPMNRGIISGLFTPEQALQHMDHIDRHLKGPDGARLMDRPLAYKGGIQEIFQRAESSTFFGREIGLMYVHEHIRYAESLAIMGKADEFVRALRQAIPVAYADVVPCGDYRQSNCYYSSSDITFRNRYDADERYAEINSGNIPLKGGWRVYSSGPGIFIGVIITRLLGLRLDYDHVIIDPVIPFSMDGLSATLNFLGRTVSIRYKATGRCHSPEKIIINGKEISMTYESNGYRQGGAIMLRNLFKSLTNQKENLIEVVL